MLNGLDLFSGIGGLSLALSEWVRPITYCEIDRYAQAVLCSRIANGELENAPIWDDIRTLHGAAFAGVAKVDIIYGGFPCQDISTAGDGAGLAGERSGLFFEITRIARDLRPPFVFLENVPAITVRGLRDVAGEFTRMGYDTRWTIVSAKEFGAAHLRRRWFLLAYANGQSLRVSESGRRREEIHAPSTLADGEITDSDGSRMAISGTQIGHGEKQPFSVELLEGNNWDEYAAFFLRMDNGLPHRGHRLRGLGNAVVPIQTKGAFMKLMGLRSDQESKKEK